MTEKTTAEKGKRGGYPRLRRSLFILMLIALLIALGVLVWAAIRVPKVLLSENPRFRLKRVSVDGAGYWSSHAEVLGGRLGLRPGGMLFALDPAEVRGRLLKIPNVRNGEVRVILPDTIQLRVDERIPRAVLFSPRSDIVVDVEGAVMRRRESAAGDQRLPLITGLRSAEIRNQLAPALGLIMAALNGYPDVSIREISVANPHYLAVKLEYRSWKHCFVLFPLAVEDYDYLLTALQSAIIDAAWRGDERSSFDLRNRGQVVLRN